MKLENITFSITDGAQTRNILHDVSLDVQPGELVAVMGPSGAGKSTLLKVAGLLQTPTSGRVIVAGQECSRMNKKQRAALRRDQLGFVFQDYNLVDTLTIAENVALPLELAGAKDAHEQALTELEALGLGAIADQFPANVSGGERQRAAIARAFIGPRSVILADEPTGALDTANSDAVMRLIRERVDAGASGMLVTHEPRLAAYSDRTVRLKDGELQ